MAKIRGIKPEYWTDEAIVELSRDARLLFIGMWNFACDNGHLADKPRQIKMRVLPADDVDVDSLLEELVAAERIVRAAGTITINRFAWHQRPHRRWWTTCDLPGCEPPDAPSQPLHNGGATVAPRLPTGGPTADVDGEGDVEGDGDVEGEVTAPAPAAQRRTPEHPLPDTWRPTATHRTYATDHRLDLDREVLKFRSHAAANERRQRNWNAAFTTWLARAEDYQPAGRRNGTNPNIPEGW